MSNARGVERRNGFHSVTDGEIGRTPNHVNSEECKDYVETAGLGASTEADSSAGATACAVSAKEGWLPM